MTQVWTARAGTHISHARPITRHERIDRPGEVSPCKVLPNREILAIYVLESCSILLELTSMLTVLLFGRPDVEPLCNCVELPPWLMYVCVTKIGKVTLKAKKWKG